MQAISQHLLEYPSELFCARRIDDLHSEGVRGPKKGVFRNTELFCISRFLAYILDGGVQPYSVRGEPVKFQMGRKARMERSIDAHQWASKMEMQCLFSGKPDLKIEEDTQTANDEPTMRAKSLRVRMSSVFKRPFI